MKIFNFKKEKEPVRLEKKEEKKKPLIIETVANIPLEFILATIIMVCFFILIVTMMGPYTESGLWFNMPHA